MFKMSKIAETKVKGSEKMLCLFKSEVSKMGTICFAFIEQDKKTGEVLNCRIPSGDFAPSLQFKPVLCAKAPEKSEYVKLDKDMKNAPLEKQVLMLFKDGTVESGSFHKNESDQIYYALFDGDSLNINPIGYIELSEEINNLLDPEYD